MLACMCAQMGSHKIVNSIASLLHATAPNKLDRRLCISGRRFYIDIAKHPLYTSKGQACHSFHDFSFLSVKQLSDVAMVSV